MLDLTALKTHRLHACDSSSALGAHGQAGRLIATSRSSLRSALRCRCRGNSGLIQGGLSRGRRGGRCGGGRLGWSSWRRGRLCCRSRSRCGLRLWLFQVLTWFSQTERNYTHLVYHADNKALLLNVVSANRLIILQDLAYCKH